ncbi:hypothetical protein AJ80_01359 [Polytolypa hystricis UAMH7299]|uniref:tRNA wybutosine-synthesizing protein 4 n=1 Tax=Polytolypa hystricis (strain UAMH7299) TaxID=1447883 RepID=A0A2B7Z054_POLH7|nr:hypothetical protein AJ80_01359 [Polytolypa hystricis UAMH7299]
MASANGKTEKEASLIMGTNNSSIVSKRSVERIYYPEPHFLRHFVKKSQRRSPPINRGYWFRMYAVERTVQKFLESSPEKRKLVLNLGCGFDPLPFQFLTHHPELCENTKFIDIDYHKLMINKRSFVRQCSALSDLFSDLEFPPETDPVLLRSGHYVGIGCDLEQLGALEAVLKTEIEALADVSILCTAEVSLTYMEVNAADAVLKWLPTLSKDVQFCLLEQHFPDGPDHPFASTMVKHFKKLNTPLEAINKYPTLHDQEQRFLNAGWNRANAESLWALWGDGSFISDAQRRALDTFEPFDEWEEFALYAAHYFLLTATTQAGGALQNNSNGITSKGLGEDTTTPHLKLVPHCPQEFNDRRRFGAVFSAADRKKKIGLHGGLGRQSRLASSDIYSLSDSEAPGFAAPPTDMTPRMCHSMTDLENADCLLIGGRASPNAGMSDCWLRHEGKWRRTDPLPFSLYRHSTARFEIRGKEHVLVYGGKTLDSDMGRWLLWSGAEGWQSLEVRGQSPCSRYGASLAAVTSQSGVLFGGMTNDKVIAEDFWLWEVRTSDDGKPFVTLQNLTGKLYRSTPLSKWLGRFGATVNVTPRGMFVIGGISGHGCIPREYEIMLVNIHSLVKASESSDVYHANVITVLGLGVNFQGPRPLLTGHSSAAVNGDDILIVGGGAVCFGFGTFCNEGTWLLQDATSLEGNNWLIEELYRP